jgi:hypothetical protein
LSDFGDFDPDDAFGTEPADPEQVARKLHEFRLEQGLEGADWDGLTLAQQTLLIVIIDRLLDLLRRQGSNF